MPNIVTVSGMFGDGKTYFAGSPVAIDISGLEWPRDGSGVPTSPFNLVRLFVVYGDTVIEAGHADTGGQADTTFNIKSALRAIWADYGFDAEVAEAQAALSADSGQAAERAMRSYKLQIWTEYLSSDDGGRFTRTQCQDEHGNTDIPGGQCLIGGLTEWERSLITNKADADVSHWEHTGVRNGDASTKPTSSPERVGSNSITSWVDVQAGYTKSIFYPASVLPENDDTPGRQQGWTGHAPIVLRDSFPYTDFLFVNRRGALETCSAPTKESMDIAVETKTYSRVERPAFRPSRSLMTVTQGGARRSWQMSSGHVTREWAEWWQTEFVPARQKWMLYKGAYVPVIVEPAKKSADIYDRARQNMPHVDFTVTLALEG